VELLYPAGVLQMPQQILAMVVKVELDSTTPLLVQLGVLEL
jgi:hypothetical protein